MPVYFGLYKFSCQVNIYTCKEVQCTYIKLGDFISTYTVCFTQDELLISLKAPNSL